MQYDFDATILGLLKSTVGLERLQPLHLGGAQGPAGGVGSPPGGFMGNLPQWKVAYDQSEQGTFATLGSGIAPSGIVWPSGAWPTWASGVPSLWDNLNHIRARVAVLETTVGFRYYLHNVASDIAGYMKVCTEFPTGTEGTSAATGKNTDDDILIEEFAAPVDCPGITFVPAGIWLSHIYAKIDSDVGDSYLKIILYKRTALGVETELWNKQDSQQLSGAVVSNYALEKTDLNDHELDVTDRLVLKVYFNTTAAANKTVTLYYDGENDHLSHLHSPIVISPADGGLSAVGIELNGVPRGEGDTLNFIEGSGVTITVTDMGDTVDIQFDCTASGIGADELVKVSANDTVARYLGQKITAATGPISITEINDGADEDLELDWAWGQVVTVMKSGGDYDDIQDALDSIVDATSSKRYVILIGPDYEGFHRNIALKSYVDLMGLGTYNQVDGVHSFHITACSPVDVSVFNLALVSISNVPAVYLTGGNVDFHHCRFVVKDSVDYVHASTVALWGGTHRFFNCGLINDASASGNRGGPALTASGAPVAPTVDLYGCRLESDGSNAACHGIDSSGNAVVNVHQGTTIVANGGKALKQAGAGVINVYSAEYNPADVSGTITGLGKDFVVGDLAVIDDARVDVIDEFTAAAGVTIDGVLIKDGEIPSVKTQMWYDYDGTNRDIAAAGGVYEEDPNVSIVINLTDESDVYVTYHLRWANLTAGGDQHFGALGKIDAVVGDSLGYQGGPANDRMIYSLVNEFPALAIGNHTVKLNIRRLNGAHAVRVYSRTIQIIAIPT